MSLSYKCSGVDISLADLWVDAIKEISRSMPRDPNVLGGIGGFSGLYLLPALDPARGDFGGTVLAACCDGVGTKIEVAREANRFEHIGQDLVAMNVNDLITCGARPLFFLDYIACGKLNASVLRPIVESVARACSESGCALLGGETAEMPGTYPEDGLDLAGFAVGIVEERRIVDGSNIEPGDVVVGISSSGVHSNGFSLVRHALLSGDSRFRLDEPVPSLGGATLAEVLLAPTKLYVRTALKACETGIVKAMAHITGGGLFDNIRRVLPEGANLLLRYNSWPRHPIFRLLAEKGIEEEEMRKVFNLGIGFCFIVSKDSLVHLMKLLEENGEQGHVIGEIVT